MGRELLRNRRRWRGVLSREAVGRFLERRRKLKQAQRRRRIASRSSAQTMAPQSTRGCGRHTRGEPI